MRFFLLFILSLSFFSFTAPAESEKAPYEKFIITSPKNQDSIFNATDISASVQVSPALQAGNEVQFFLDHNPIHKPSTLTTIIISKVENGKAILVRGTHTLSAKIINKDGDEIKATPDITFFLHYAKSLKEH